MAIDAEELLLRPFHDVTARAQDAISNGAVGSDPHSSLAKAGQMLLKEGERALSKIQPLWNAHTEKYGSTFGERMIQNGMRDAYGLFCMHC
jgi:hypothetical protein